MTSLQKPVTISLLAGLGAWLIAGIWMDPGITGIGAGVLVAGMAFGVQRTIPWLGRARRTCLLEMSLPLSLLTLSAYLENQLTIEEGLFRLAGETNGPLGDDLRRMADEVQQRNRDWPTGLLEWSRKTGSASIRRAVGQWIGYSRWGDSQQAAINLRQLAKDLLDIERSRVRSLSSRMAMGSILIVVMAAVVPALFLSFSLLASQVLSFSIPIPVVQLITLAGFPLATLLIAAMMWGPAFYRFGGEDE